MLNIGGVEVSGPAEDILVFPRSTGNVVFKARACDNMDEFQSMIPEPVAGTAWSKEKGHHKVTDDPDYKAQVKRYNELHFAWMALNSLAPSDIKWNTVIMEKPNTWPNWEEELRKAGFVELEIRRIVGLIMSVNCLDDAKLKAAREDFLQGQVEEAEGDHSGQEEDPPSSESGPPASESE